MAALLAEHRLTVVICVTLVIAFLWLDVALYFRVQNLRSPPPSSQHVTSDGIHHQLPLSTSSVTIKSLPTIALSKNNNHVSSHNPEHIFSPFKGLSVKMVMMDQVNNYLFTPFSELFNDVTQFSKTFTFITPNMISFTGLIVALISAKFVSSDSFLIRRIAVLVFQIRTFLDALDGIVARDRRGITKHVSVVGTSGYFVDGACDAIGFAAFLIGLYVYLRRFVPRNCKYIPLDIHCSSQTLNVVNPSHRHVFIACFCFGMQLAASATFWNIYLDRYHTLLEDPAVTVSEANLQTEVMRSSITWSLMWFWRVLNAHALMQYLLIAVFVNRAWEFILWAQYPGIVAIGTLTFFSEIHVRDISSYLERAKIIS